MSKKIIFMFFLFPSLALANEWQLIYEDLEKGNLYINSDKVTVDKNGNLIIEVKSVPNLPNSNLLKINYVLNCKTQQLGISQYTEYSYKKAIKPNTRFFRHIEMKPIRLGNVGEILNSNFGSVKEQYIR